MSDEMERHCTGMLAQFMIINGFATGHGESFPVLLSELQWQLDELRTKRQWQPIETAPKDDRIRVWSWGEERHARWNPDKHAMRPRPFWQIEGIQLSTSREHQPEWWMLTSPPPPGEKT